MTIITAALRSRCGHYIFAMCINDVTDLFHDNVSIKLFADDIKLYMEIKDNSQTVMSQEYINVASDWADKWQLKLSYNKCHHFAGFIALV